MSAKTREKILNTALQMFNERGERTVTTNHIAAELGISPGNLYYHFKNKEQIISELFSQLSQLLESRICLPSDRPLTFADKKAYLETTVESLWAFRFIYRDAQGFIHTSTKLSDIYSAFARSALEMLNSIYSGLVDAKLLNANKIEIEALSLNTFLVLGGWLEAVRSCYLDEGQELSHSMIKRAVYQVLLLGRGFITDRARSAFTELEQHYYYPLTGK